MKYNQGALSSGFNTSPYDHSQYADPNEAKVYKKLNELNTVLNQATIKAKPPTGYSGAGPLGTVALKSADMDRLERMMNRTGKDDYSEDPEMKQLSGMMDKILDIQHPERVKEKKEQKSETAPSHTYAVKATSGNNNTSLLSRDNISPGETIRNNDDAANGFFSLVEDMENTPEQPNTI